MLEKSLYEDYVAPDVVEAGVALVDADFAKAYGEEQFSAGGVLDEDFGEEFPEAASPGFPYEGLHRQAAGAAVPFLCAGGWSGFSGFWMN